jgi:hypothetical protein
MRAVTYFAIALITITSVAFAVWSYDIRPNKEAVQFAPAIAPHIWLPAGTPINAVIIDGISSAAAPGDGITAFISKPVVLAGMAAIPTGMQLKGKLKKISAFDEKVKATINFNVLDTGGGRSLNIQTRPLTVVAPVQSDAKILGAALKMVIEAGIGAGVGVANGDNRFVRNFMLQGARSWAAEESAVSITVILLHDLKI